MIFGAFRIGGDVSEVIVDENNLLFRDTSTSMTTPISGLRLSKAGVLKEFPDLKEDKEWKEKAIERLKSHLKTIEGEKKKLDYVKEELTKFGYTALFWQKAGFRPQKWRELGIGS